MGYDAYCVGEVAGPPGDVGFVKLRGEWSCHCSLELLRMMVSAADNGGIGGARADEEDSALSVIGPTLHSSFGCGAMRPLTFNGLLDSGGTLSVPSSDKFYLGGPGQLRGFLLAGVCPRASMGGSGAPGRDVLGGDLFYASTLAASVLFPSYFAKLRHNGPQLFGFVDAGTCVSAGGLLGAPVWSGVLHSSRVAGGGGVSAGTPMGRFKATYAVPVRYGPRDARKVVQFGFGFSFG